MREQRDKNGSAGGAVAEGALKAHVQDWSGASELVMWWPGVCVVLELQQGHP